MAENNSTLSQTLASDPDEVFFRPLPGELLRITALGASTGLALPLLVTLLDQFFSKPVFCGSVDGSAQLCQATTSIDYAAVLMVLAIGATLLLAHWRVYRPLLISLAATLALWGLQNHIAALTTHSFLEYIVYSIVAFTAIYLLFYWIMRLRNLAASVVISLVVVVSLRWLLLI